MPPALHPKSTQTLSLFTTTLVLGFGVVTLPHIFPCPVDHRRRMHADGKAPERRRRKPSEIDAVDSSAGNVSTDAKNDSSNLFAREPSSRECPVPKPNGFIGQILGFKTSPKPETIVKVEVAKPSNEQK
jgi:cytochrome c oxidase assembly factor 2